MRIKWKKLFISIIQLVTSPLWFPLAVAVVLIGKTIEGFIRAFVDFKQ